MKLEPCPFCGSKAKLLKDFAPRISGRKFRYMVTCTEYRCVVHPQTGWFSVAKRVISVWNHRENVEQRETRMKQRVGKEEKGKYSNAPNEAEIVDFELKKDQEPQGIRKEVEEVLRSIKRNAEAMQEVGGSTLLPDIRTLKNRLDGFMESILDEVNLAIENIKKEKR